MTTVPEDLTRPRGHRSSSAGPAERMEKELLTHRCSPDSGLRSLEQKRNVKSSWRSFCSFTPIAIAAFIVYLGVTANAIYKLTVPPAVLDNSPSLDPGWKAGENLDIECYISPRQAWSVYRESDFHRKDVWLAWKADGYKFVWSADGHDRFLDVKRNFSASANRAGKRLWKYLWRNQTLYLHAHVTRHGYSPDPEHTSYAPHSTIHASAPLTKILPKADVVNATRLLARFFPHLQKNDSLTVRNLASEYFQDFKDEPDPYLSAYWRQQWKPSFAIHLVTDFTRYHLQAVPPLIFQALKHYRSTSGTYHYLPVVHIDEMGLTRDKLLEINRSVDTLPLTLSLAPMSLARWQLMLAVEEGMKTQKGLGFQDSDIDDLRSMIAETNPYLLMMTMTVALVHVLIDILAFKNDISFWREKKSLRGLSLRSMVTSLVSQAVILLYLIEKSASLLIIVPSTVSLGIQWWKIQRMTGITLHLSGGWGPQFTFPRLKRMLEHKNINNTANIDRIATQHLSLVLYPLIIGYGLYSLIYFDHRGWYSWLLSSASGVVYTFGFILMTPQLFINYKLKSVAHLPWKFLIYRALNTFIDDMFAFIIKMPTMHRLSCFRDDIIFLIYLYQRWVYPVDSSRNIDTDDMPDKES